MMVASVVSHFEVMFFDFICIISIFFSISYLPPSHLTSNNKIFQSTGTFFAASRYGSATPVPASIISRGSGWLVRCAISVQFVLEFFSGSLFLLLVLDSYFLINSSLIWELEFCSMACLVLSLALVHLCKMRIYFTCLYKLTKLYGMIEIGWNL